MEWFIDHDNNKPGWTDLLCFEVLLYEANLFCSQTKIWAAAAAKNRESVWGGGAASGKKTLLPQTDSLELIDNASFWLQGLIP